MSKQFFENFFHVLRPIKVLTKVRFKMLQFLVVMYIYDMGYLRCVIDAVKTVEAYFLCLSTF